MGWLFLIFIIALPVLEIAIFIEVAGEIGILSAIAAAILAAILGLLLLRKEGFATLRKAQREIDEGRTPVAEIIDGLCLLLAGAMLLLPGFLTDVVGLLLLLPPVRAAAKGALAHRMVAMTERQNRPSPAAGPAIIDADFREVDDGKTPHQGPNLPKSD